MALEELSFESVNRQMHRRMDDGQKVTTTAHPEQSSGELIIIRRINTLIVTSIQVIAVKLF